MADGDYDYSADSVEEGATSLKGNGPSAQSYLIPSSFAPHFMPLILYKEWRCLLIVDKSVSCGECPETMFGRCDLGTAKHRALRACLVLIMFTKLMLAAGHLLDIVLEMLARRSRPSSRVAVLATKDGAFS
jgi:hypothetical protein